MNIPTTRQRVASLINFGVLLAAVLLLCSNLSAQQSTESGAQPSGNWPRFHGPNGTGLAEQSNLPTEISDANFQWKVKLAGLGSSSPVIWGDKIFVTGGDPQTAELTLQCLSAKTGEESWSKSFESTPYRVHNLNNYAASTPVVDDQHVYFTFASPEHVMLVALDHEGQVKWKRDFGTWRSQHGFGISPTLCQDKVILVNSQLANPSDGATGGSRVIAVNCDDGKDAWVSPLTATRTCYALPCVYQGSDGKEQLISYNTGDGFFSLDPATGKQNWKTPSSPFRQRTIASTLIVDDLIIGSNGSGGGGNYLVTMKLNDTFNQAPQPVYQLQRANYVPSPIVVDGRLFVFTDKGIGQCFDVATGEQLWQQRMSKGFSGSPVSDSKNIFLLADDGNLFVIAVANEYKLLSKHFLGEAGTSTPAISGDRIYLRTDTHLICVE